MVRTTLLALALLLPGMAATAADTRPAVVKQPTATLASQPVRIVRKPPVFRAAPAPLTASRVLTKSAIAQAVNSNLRLSSALKARLAAPPSKRALVIIMENGGIMNNVDPTLRAQLNVNIRTATCGDWEFELRQGENIASLVTRIASQLGGNLQCLNPGNWRTTTFNPLTWLNEVTDNALENAVKANGSLINTQTYYDRVVVMEDADATPQRVLPMIRSLAPTHTIDIHVLTHGGNEFFVGHNGAVFNASTFFNPLQADKNAGRLFIRAVYQMNCSSGTLKDNWTALGAITVNGTNGTNLNNMPFQYFHWLTYWFDRMGNTDASQRAYDEAAAYAMPIYSLAGQANKVSVSRLTTAGPKPNANVVARI